MILLSSLKSLDSEIVDPDPMKNKRSVLTHPSERIHPGGKPQRAQRMAMKIND